ILMNTIVSNNFAGEEAGGIYCYDSNVSLDSVLISDNHAGDGGGGGVLYHQSNLNLVNVLISGNSASSGGGIYCSNSNSSLENVTFSNNSAEYYNGGGIYYHDGSMNLVNCILWNDSPEEIYIYSSFVTATYSDIQGGWAGTGNIDAEPLFADPQNFDFHLTWANFPIPDSTKSPCIDAGDPNSPLDPDGTIADMGAYYFNQNVSVDDPQEISSYMLVNYPNPISINNINLTVSFSIHKPGKVKIQLFNIKGQLVSTIIDEEKNIGNYTISHSFNDLSSGIYFTKLSVDGIDIEIKKVILLR
ncbi:MAG: T9SS type A sorting domain-containing protein, partial [Candidatus Cloacimonetes bacterium]|nr:T9SS type A sorting domain-containing protein [Candidatus Cloacimonadota bacterium]